MATCWSASGPVFAVEPALTSPTATRGNAEACAVSGFCRGTVWAAAFVWGSSTTRTARSPVTNPLPSTGEATDTVSWLSITSTRPTGYFSRAMVIPEVSLISSPSRIIRNCPPAEIPSLVPLDITSGLTLTTWAGKTISRILLAASWATCSRKGKSSRFSLPPSKSREDTLRDRLSAPRIVLVCASITRSLSRASAVFCSTVLPRLLPGTATASTALPNWWRLPSTRYCAPKAVPRSLKSLSMSL